MSARLNYFLRSSVTALTGGLLLTACSAVPGPAQSGASPSSFNPPQAQQIVSATASGVQTYTCEFDAQHQLHWVFKSPLATLYDASGKAVIQHAAGPSWQADDGSRIVGHVIASRPSTAQNSIPELLLETKSTSGKGTLSGVRYVQRVNTVGGLAPKATCSSEHQAGSSPYLAEYVFYRQK